MTYADEEFKTKSAITEDGKVQTYHHEIFNELLDFEDHDTMKFYVVM